MKTFKFFSTSLVLLSTVLISCNSGTKTKTIKVVDVQQKPKQEAPIEQKIFPVSFDGLIASYLVIKDALVADNSKAAASEAAQFLSIITKLEGSEMEEVEHQMLEASAPKMKQHAQQMIQGELPQQREELEILTDEMIAMIEISGSSITLYQQYCPMYKGNEGGIWLSDVKEIRNPLFGSKMLKCGIVQAEIN